MEPWREELYSNELYHHGIRGQKWGQRRYQYNDGSLTPAGKRRYGGVKGAARNLLSKVYESNENYYTKRAKKLKKKARRPNLYANMNKTVKEQMLRKAEKEGGVKGAARRAAAKLYESNEKYYRKRENKIRKRIERNEMMAKLNRRAKNEFRR